MQVTTTINMRGVLAAIKKAQVSPARSKRALKMAAVSQVREIKTRTKDGEGLNGAFKGYSKDYFDIKAKRKGGMPDVNLFYSGRMLANLGVVKATSNFALLSFSSQTERKKAKANQRTRPFMGIKPDEQKSIMRIFKRELFK
jgi:hypothetical protein